MQDRKPVKILLGGSPCTHWSIAQSKNRETVSEGQGWELFLNYVIAKEKFKPDYFLYENVASASKEIKAEIAKALGVELMQIDSALLSAQMRKRIYGFNWICEQPADRGIVLKDVLENGENLTGGEKSHCLTATYEKAAPWNTIEKRQRTMVAERVGIYPTGDGRLLDSQGMRIYSEEGKSVTLAGQGGGMGAKTGLYAIYQGLHGNKGEEAKNQNIYEVKGGYIDIKGRRYPIKLKDGRYVIRKLMPVECERLQTMPDGYTKGISDTQRYKCLGNGWTAAVIEHILQAGIGHLDRDTHLQVLSLYDGIGTGRYVLHKMGFWNIEYRAYEIDKFAIQVAKRNWPDIVECGDAFAVREENWEFGG